jgi:predicted SAM-dependent methyltransferase
MSRNTLQSHDAGQPSEAGPVLVNLGCGLRYHSAWKNLDLHSRTPDVTEYNFLEGLPFPDGSVDAVYCAAVVEHLPKDDVPPFIAECHRVLKAGGILRISVPDFEAQARLYLDLLEQSAKGDPSAARRIDWMIIEMLDQYGRDKSGGLMAEFLARHGQEETAFIEERIGKEGTSAITKLSKRGFDASVNLKHWRQHLVRGGALGLWLLKFLLRSKDIRRDLAALEVGRFRLFSGEVHRWAYSYGTLAGVIERQGFSELQRMPHGESRIAGWKYYHLEIDTSGNVEKPDLFVVEARKQNPAPQQSK